MMIKFKIKYVLVNKNPSINPSESTNNIVSQFFNELEVMLDQLIQQNSIVISTLTTLISKFFH